MPYVGGSLVSLFDKKAQAVVRVAHRKMVVRGGETIKQIAHGNTPRVTGVLAQGWKLEGPLPARDSAGDALMIVVLNDVSYARDVEYGTGLYGPKHAKYLIEPKKPGGWLHWIGKDGKDVFARRVMHPGSPGVYMLATAMNMVDAALRSGVMFRDILTEMAVEIERGAR